MKHCTRLLAPHATQAAGRLLILSFSLFLNLSISPALHAQHTPVEKYHIAPASFEEVFLDHVEFFGSRTIDVSDNQYLGQVDKDGHLYGYGMFINGDGSQIIGKFRNNKLLFGITIAQNSVAVGEPNFYASYSLSTGRIEYVFRANEKVLLDTHSLLEYGFVSMKYANGDQYVGEVYQRQRHGFGIYYYANGDFWFGEYDKDIRSGYGAYFSVEGDITIGQWEGEDEKRTIRVKKK